jgi:DtxR family Mn-dependent transcriptional regulator
VISASMQDYLKAVYELAERNERVTTTLLADRLGVTPTSVTAMVKRLAELNLIEHEPYQGVHLADAGRGIALEVIRHHRLIELYLAEALGVPWDQVHEEAEKLEHVISEDLERRMAEALGNPVFDPHGSPIPTHDGRLHDEDLPSNSLAECSPGSAVVVAEVDDRDPEFLRYLARNGVLPGVRLDVLGTEPFGGPFTLRIGGEVCQLGPEAAQRIRVRRVAAA